MEHKARNILYFYVKIIDGECKLLGHGSLRVKCDKSDTVEYKVKNAENVQSKKRYKLPVKKKAIPDKGKGKKKIEQEEEEPLESPPHESPPQGSPPQGSPLHDSFWDEVVPSSQVGSSAAVASGLTANVDPPNFTGIMLSLSWGRSPTGSLPSSLEGAAHQKHPLHHEKERLHYQEVTDWWGVASRTRSSDRLRGIARGSGNPRQLFIDLTEPVVGSQVDPTTQPATQASQKVSGKQKEDENDG
ncbi:hypothetical protein CJ030_MR1G020572 [Morella rubra]|uniref:Uncharacterized protein n=1 Tax=Morella rubra TaxID=262757 RepID=A0A6A1WM10_9ROSI|nr:hypothetical protein CJ030_MR1G020572 [Morella rubra]